MPTQTVGAWCGNYRLRISSVLQAIAHFRKGRIFDIDKKHRERASAWMIRSTHKPTRRSSNVWLPDIATFRSQKTDDDGTYPDSSYNPA